MDLLKGFWEWSPDLRMEKEDLFKKKITLITQYVIY